ncbi:MAG: MmcQ/YjbR family DNA-binding protein [Chloroflexota bacterium]
MYAYCESKPGVTAGYPFGEGALVFKVMSKMFVLISENENPLRMNLKCDPDDAQALRAEHTAIIPGFHMNKKHWNTIVLNGSLQGELVAEMIDHSYDLVVAKLKRAEKEDLKGR